MPERLTMQGKILDALQAVITDVGLDAVQHADYANTGTLYAQHGFETCLAITYRFNAHYVHLAVQEGAALRTEDLIDPPSAASPEPDRAGAKLSWRHLRYTEAENLTAMVALVRKLLSRRSTARTLITTALQPQPTPALDLAQLATHIAANYPPHTHPEAGLLLGDRVHDHAARIASEINNSGQPAQIQYLLEHGHTEADIRDVLNT